MSDHEPFEGWGEQQRASKIKSEGFTAGVCGRPMPPYSGGADYDNVRMGYIYGSMVNSQNSSVFGMPSEGQRLETSSAGCDEISPIIALVAGLGLAAWLIYNEYIPHRVQPAENQAVWPIRGTSYVPSVPEGTFVQPDVAHPVTATRMFVVLRSRTEAIKVYGAPNGERRSAVVLPPGTAVFAYERAPDGWFKVQYNHKNPNGKGMKREEGYIQLKERASDPRLGDLPMPSGPK